MNQKPPQRTNFEPIPEGIHDGVLFKIVETGTQVDPVDPKKRPRVCYFYWELPGVTYDFEGDNGQKITKRRIVMKKCTVSYGAKDKPSNLRKLLQGWLKRDPSEAELYGFNYRSMLEAPAKITIVQDTKGEETFSNVYKIGKAPTEAPMIKPENEVLYWEIEDLRLGIPETFSAKLKAEIQNSQEFKARQRADQPSKMTPDEIIQASTILGNKAQPQPNIGFSPQVVPGHAVPQGYFQPLDPYVPTVMTTHGPRPIAQVAATLKSEDSDNIPY